MLFFFIALPVPVNAASEGDERFAAAVAAAAAAVLSDRPEIVPPLAKMACSKCCCRTLRFWRWSEVLKWFLTWLSLQSRNDQHCLCT